MANMVQEIKKEKKKPAVKKISKQSSTPAGNTFYTYIQMVEKKAYDLYEKRGCEHGYDLEDWFEAERLVEDELCTP